MKSLPQAPDVVPRDDALHLARVLFSLCRRHSLAFSVVAVRPHGSDASGASSDGEGRRGASDRDSVWSRGLAGKPHDRLVRAIAEATRETDVTVEWDREGFVIFCPSTASQGAKELAARIDEASEPIPIGVGSASFREDAYTLDELIEHAWDRERQTYGPGPRGGAGGGGSSNRAQRRIRGRALEPSRRRRFGARIKRWFDVLIVLATAPLSLPLVGLIALAIKAADPAAPAFFAQLRTGRGGRRFRMLKFRTMVPDAEAAKVRLRHLNRLQWPDFKIDDDPRITPLGRVLRKSSLDELPQLWNVLRGDMSLVGPRPTSFPPEAYEPWQTARLDVPPGLTGLWQVEGRTTTEFDERLRLDLAYVAKQSFVYDLKILARTVPALFQMRGGA